MTTTTQTPAAVKTCPPSDVVDMIVRLEDVPAGELVLWDSELCPLESNEPHAADGTLRMVSLAGWPFPGCFPGARLTAVRRYTEGISEQDALVIAALDEAAADRDERARDARQQGRTDEEQEHTGRAAEYRAERDRREAGR